MTDILLLAVVAALYVLGAYQGGTIADVIDETSARSNMELSRFGRFVLTWLWPYSTIRAILESNDD